MIRLHTLGVNSVDGWPRTSGDDPQRNKFLSHHIVLAPHERG